MKYRVKFEAGFTIYTEWFDTLKEATEIAHSMQYAGIYVLCIEDENYEVV